MTYEDWSKNSARILEDAKNFNNWQDEAREKLLSDIGPRIAQLRKRGYLGSGFHYELEVRFGKLIAKMAYPWQPNANNCDKINDDISDTILRKLIFKEIINQVEEAEKSLG